MKNALLTAVPLTRFRKMAKEFNSKRYNFHQKYLFLTHLTPHRLRVFENRIMKKLFGPKRDEVTGEWKRLYNEELTDLYCSPNIRLMTSRMTDKHVACMESERGAYRNLVGRPKGQRQLGRHKVRWHNNIKVDLQAVGWKRMERCQ